MKKLLSILLLFALLLSLVSCGGRLSEDTNLPTATEEKKTEKETITEEALSTEPIVYPDTFSVGYARRDMTPEMPIPTYDGTVARSVYDPVQMTCTAICDGEDVFLLISLDLRGCPTSLTDASAKIIEKNFGIPKERVFLNATHTHSAPDNGKLYTPELIPWQKLYSKLLPLMIDEALRDLTPTEVYSGVSNTDGITFVRRYLMANGTYETNASGGAVVEHESEADTQLRTLRFDREGDKKDVLLVNYQTHYDGRVNQGKVSADFIHPFRETAEKELNCHFAYHQGAAGNLNFRSGIPGERLYKNYELAIPEFMETVKEALASEEKLETGKMQSQASYYQGRTWDSDTGVVDGSTREVRLYAVSFGDIAFCSAPYEMFDKNGKDIREASPYKMTFVCAYTNGHLGYVPTAEAFPHGAYEVSACSFAPGSGEEFANELIRLLNACKTE